MTPDDITRNPDLLTAPLALKSGAPAVFRVLRPDDAARLGRYFAGLSKATTERYGPHPFDMATAQQLCDATDYRKTLRLLAVTQAGAIIAYFILGLWVTGTEQERYAGYGIALDGDRDCTFAPSVADAHQSSGLGSAMMPHVLDTARRLGRRQMVLLGGTQATNYRAIHFYEKFGFRKVGDFTTRVDNHDMVLAL
ncbi:MAG: GNAT family N-acetyltransferase [Anaerolineae bacterium]|nr:GNAT family N-acetyltransferase [Anaerolineae bacterium]